MMQRKDEDLDLLDERDVFDLYSPTRDTPIPFLYLNDLQPRVVWRCLFDSDFFMILDILDMHLIVL